RLRSGRSRGNPGRTGRSGAAGRRIKRALLSDVTGAGIRANRRRRDGIEVSVRSACNPRENRGLLVRSNDPSTQVFIAPEKGRSRWGRPEPPTGALRREPAKKQVAR